MGLCAFDDPENPALKRGIEYLCRMQNADGSWTEHETTGTGFPKVFYLKYDMYRNAWPLLALATYRKILDRAKTPHVNGAVNGSINSTRKDLNGATTLSGR
jgi:squalene-hopene/tetraprenyl-beta-curcumene cyclase